MAIVSSRWPLFQAIVSTAQPLFQSWCIKTNAKESSDKSEHSKSSAVADDSGVCGHEFHGRGLGDDSGGVGSHVREGERGWMARFSELPSANVTHFPQPSMGQLRAQNATTVPFLSVTLQCGSKRCLLQAIKHCALLHLPYRRLDTGLCDGLSSFVRCQLVCGDVTVLHRRHE